MDVKVHDKILNQSISENVFEKVTKFDIKKCVFSSEFVETVDNGKVLVWLSTLYYMSLDTAQVSKLSGRGCVVCQDCVVYKHEYWDLIHFY